MPTPGVGPVTTQFFTSKAPFNFIAGGQLSEVTLAYETYGELNTAKDNAVLVCHALSGSQHAAGTRADNKDDVGWWDAMIGPGRPLDTEHFYIIATNNIGGCHGSTGPNVVDPNTGRPFGPDFPKVAIEDWVEAQVLLADHLQIGSFAAVVGGSIGGMQALSWSIRYPARVRCAVMIAGTPRLTTQNIAFNEISRQSIMRDPDFSGGHFYDSQPPTSGLAVARMLGHVTYLSDHDMQNRFGRERLGDTGVFQIESYLRHQGDKFSQSFDANTYLLMTRALDAFDPAAAADGDLIKALSPARAEFLILSFQSDWRFPPASSHELVKALIAARKKVSYAELSARGGHDSFLLNDPTYHRIVKGFLRTKALM